MQRNEWVDVERAKFLSSLLDNHWLRLEFRERGGGKEGRMNARMNMQIPISPAARFQASLSRVCPIASLGARKSRHHYLPRSLSHSLHLPTHAHRYVRASKMLWAREGSSRRDGPMRGRGDANHLAEKWNMEMGFRHRKSSFLLFFLFFLVCLASSFWVRGDPFFWTTFYFYSVQGGKTQRNTFKITAHDSKQRDLRNLSKKNSPLKKKNEIASSLPWKYLPSHESEKGDFRAPQNRSNIKMEWLIRGPVFVFSGHPLTSVLTTRRKGRPPSAQSLHFM